MNKKKIRALKAEVKVLEKATFDLIGHLDGVAKIMASQKEQITALQVSELTLAESMKIVYTTLSIDQQPGTKDPDRYLTGYQ
jgi:hypothetical protein